MGGQPQGEAIAPRSALLDSRFLLALVLLVANDRIFKGLWPGLVTGKLSDLAGMIVGPVVVAEILRFFGVRRQASAVIGLAVSATYLTVINVSTSAAALAAGGLASLTGVSQQIVVDSTDLIALAVLPITWCLVANPNPIRLRRQMRTAILAVGVAASLASSSSGPTVYSDVSVAEGGTVELMTAPYGETEDWRTSRDGGETWVPSRESRPVTERQQTVDLCLTEPSTVCLNIGPGAEIREQRSPDDPWRSVWELDNDESWVGRMTLSVSTPQIEATDMVELPDGSVVVAMGELDPIRRTIDGRWTPSIADLREMPWNGLALAGVAFALVTASSAIAHGDMRGPQVVGLGWLGAVLAAPCAVGTMLLAIAVDGFIVGGFLAYLGLPALLLGLPLGLSALLRARAFGDESQRQAVRVVCGLSVVGSAVAVVTFGLWANDLFPGTGRWEARLLP